jgi:NAD(P)H-dependent FMN reductase
MKERRMSKSRLGVVICSTRPGRIGLPIGTWFAEQARLHAAFDVDVVDLAEVNLPFLDEPHHPRLQKYEKPHTKAWSARVSGLDAFAFVTPEYNYAMPAPLKNALDFLVHEWAYKPAAFVSYGGVAAGQRSATLARVPISALRMMPIPEGVTIPFAGKHVQDGKFVAPDEANKASKAVLDELHKWAGPLAGMRKPAA